MTTQKFSPTLAGRAKDVLLITLLALGGVGTLLLALGLSPVGIAATLAGGVFASWQKFSHVLTVWVPLMLCGCGLLFTFRAGLWNIGIEGQVILGAIGATFVLRSDGLGFSPGPLLALAIASGFVCGGLWGGFAGLLKTRGGVNEIFGGLGLNFVAQGFLLWLILGPWKREGIASMSGTDLFSRELWMAMPAGWRVAPTALTIAACVFLATWYILHSTRFGLRVKAVGANPAAAALYAIRADRTGLAAMLLGGGIAGIAGGLQVACVYHRLIPAISSGYGYLALLVVMLAGYAAAPVPFICLFFAALAAGSIQLPIVLQLDSSLSGVIQGACVVAALLVHGWRKTKKEGA